jgi:hypothetical protein
LRVVVNVQVMGAGARGQARLSSVLPSAPLAV